MLHEPGETQASDNKAWEPELAAEKQPSLKCFSTPPPRNPLPTPQLHKYALSVFKRLSAQISQCVKSAPVRVCMCVSFYSVYQRLRVDVENVCIHVSAFSLAGSCHWKRLNSKLS